MDRVRTSEQEHPDTPVSIRISVRNLVEFLLRSGDIDIRIGKIDSDAMALGRSIHRKIQSGGGAKYRAEVSLSDTMDYPEDGCSLTVEGRADGIIEDKDGVIIDEIKGMFRDVREITEPIPVHLAQAKCYAYMYLKQNPLDDIAIQLTYVNMDTEEVRRLKQTFPRREIEAWYLDLLSQYRRWAKYTVSHMKARQKSIRQMEFPYSYREGQKKLVASVYRTIERKKKLFIQAPTGSGKTLAAVFPAVKAVGEGLSSRIFYLTARTVTRTVAEDCFRILEDEGLDFLTVTITAREKLCPLLPQYREIDENAKTPCDPEQCPYARGHFDRVNDAIYRLLTGHEDVPRHGPLTREDILEAAAKYQVCPSELTLDLTDWADGIICDYNYVFDPNARLQRFFANDSKGDFVFLIDEAHNLVDRGRDMYSADLLAEEFTALKRTLKRRHAGPVLQKKLESCRKYLEGEKKDFLEKTQVDFGAIPAPGTGAAAVPGTGAAAVPGTGAAHSYRKVSSLGTFPVLLTNLQEETEKFLEEEHSMDLTGEVVNFYFRILEFQGALDRYSVKYVTTEDIQNDGRFRLRIACLDPSADLQACMDKGRSAILFSATLLPISYYRSLLSARADDYAVYASTVFDPSRRKVLIGSDVSTRYQDRGPETYRKIAEYIRRTAAAKAGNYMVFFSSYRMMENTYEQFDRIRSADVKAIMQSSGMSEQEREEFLASFRVRDLSRTEHVPGSGSRPEGEDSGMNDESSVPHTLVGFCVMGSFFGEGIDLKGESLIGVIVAGAGIPQVGPERELLKEYFDARGMDGFFYSYTCPGLAKVLQAAGRVIRTEEDRGVIVLIDSRFSRYAYRSLFPREWADAEYVSADNISSRLEQFWKTY